MSGNTAYKEIVHTRAKMLKNVSDTMIEALNTANPRDRYPSGRGAKSMMHMRKHYYK